MTNPKIGILMGSKSDADIMGEASRILEEFGVPHEMKVLSAHRTPQETSEYAQSAESKGIQVLIAGAGYAAHLAGALAAQSTLPIIGVPLDASSLQGLDSLLSTVQMPKESLLPVWASVRQGLSTQLFSPSRSLLEATRAWLRN